MAKFECINQSIIDLYSKRLEELEFKNVEVRSIHNDRDICFNASNREELYSIQDCFTEKNEGEMNSNFKENIFGKCLNIGKDIIPKVPPFDNLIKFYIKNFIKRLEKIETRYTKSDLSSLKYEREELLKKEFNHDEYLQLRKKYDDVVNS